MNLPDEQEYYYADEIRKSRDVYGILGLLLGTLGAHNFYAGYLKKGFTQLILSTLIPFICLILFIRSLTTVVLILGPSAFTLIWPGVYLWALTDIIRVKKDHLGIEMKPLTKIFWIACVLLFLIIPITFVIFLAASINGH